MYEKAWKTVNFIKLLKLNNVSLPEPTKIFMAAGVLTRLLMYVCICMRVAPPDVHVYSDDVYVVT